MVGHKEEVVISGIGGLFPEANNVEELKDLLFNKVNGITMDSSRWNQYEQSIRSGTGKIKNIDNFDMMFFKAHPKLANVMDLLTILSLERSIEAIVDAGLSPTNLSGTNTGVFMCSSFCETEIMFLSSSNKLKFAIQGHNRAMQANRLSYILNLTGPSFTTDGGWICSSNSLEKAKTMIENGQISSALVGVTNLCLRPETQYQFQGLNRLNHGVCTKPFSIDADGYNRSEACIVMFLQKVSEAKRSYGTLLSVNSVQFGDNQKYLTNHDGNHFKSLLLDCYKKANIDPASVEYIEAYGSGIKNEDNLELNVMEEVFCTKQRKKPLKVGSVKSNVGHCEASGLFMSIVKAVIALETGFIPPNINYTESNKDLPAVKNGKIQIVTEKTPLVSDVIGISSFGIINAFSHVILKRNNKAKCSSGALENNDCIPRLILASGRNEENVRETVNIIMKHGKDAEFLALTHEVFTTNISTHFYRCFSIFPSMDESRIIDVWNVSHKKRPVWFIFSGMGSQWHGMGLYLMSVPLFAEAINKCDSILKPRGIDIKYILTSLDRKLFDNILNSFVGIAAIQIGLVNVLKALDIVPDGIIGHSLGELGCAYADGCLTAEEMLLSAYARGRASLETNLIPGMMAAVGLGYHQIKDRLPCDIDVACHNNVSCCTISGPVDSINAFVSQLKSEGIFAKSVDVAGIAYHSRYIQSAGPISLKYLKEVIKEPKPRSLKWISTSLPETQWNSDLAKYSSAEYLTNNLLSSVLFEDALKKIPSDAITIEIAPHGLLQAIIKKALPDSVSNIPLTKRMHGDSVRYLLNAVGKMYSCGLNPKVQGIYPKITFPVSRETPSLLIPLWDHSQKLVLRKTANLLMNTNPAEKFTLLVLTDEIHLNGYQIHGHHIIPPSFILFNVWKLFIEMNDKTMNCEQVQFQNLRFKNNIGINLNDSCGNYIMIQIGTGHFEYNIDNELIASGQIRFLNEKDFDTKSIKPLILDKISNTYEGHLYEDEIYAMLKNNGYCLGNNYKNIIKLDNSEKLIQGYVKWTNDWVYFIDGLLKFTLLDDLNTHKVNAPVSIREIKINPAIFKNISDKDVYVSYIKVTNEINCMGVKISGVKNSPLILPKVESAVFKIEERIFFQFNHSICKNIDEFISESMDIILETNRLKLETINEKLVVCIPHHYDDSIFKACTKSLKQFLDNQLSTNTLTLNCDNIGNILEHGESGRFITVINVHHLHDTLQVFADKKCSYIIVYSEHKLQDLNNWKIIIQQKFKNISYLALIKKDTILDKCSVFLKHTYENCDLNIWRAINKYNALTGKIFIIFKSEPFEGIYSYVKNMLIKYKSERLRFLFILDQNAPDFDSDKSFYKNQLTKDLLINIYKNGGWGSYKKILIQDLKDKMKITENSITKILTKNNERIRTVKYLGLNHKDFVVEDKNEDEFGPFDFTALAENDKLIMGIASVEQKSSKIIFDSFLSWPVPSTWTAEDATTVPYTYAMSYYVFNILCPKRKGNSILVTSGLHHIGQSAIAIGLAENYEMYAVVESKQEADLLSNIFPKLSRSRIIVNINDKFDIKLLMITKSKGVNLVLNFLNGEGLQAALRSLTNCSGEFINFSKSDMKTNEKLGLRAFLNGLSFTVISSNMLLNESNQNKRVVRQLFMDGLNKGLIKPFPRFDSTTALRSRNIFDTMRTAFSLTAPQKVVLSVNDVLATSKSLSFPKLDTIYQCHPDQVNVIVDSELSWLDVAEWLVDRGARKIVILVKKCFMSSAHSRKFDRMISKNLSIQVESHNILERKEELLNWLNRLTSFSNLGSLFIINQLDSNLINNMRYAFEENKKKTNMTSFVCVSSNGELSCADLKSIGLNALNISWDENLSQQPKISKILCTLDIVMYTLKNKNSSSFVCSEKGTDKSEWSQKVNEIFTNYLPNSVEDLYSLNGIIEKEVGFVEVQTRSPRYSQLKSVVPVFVIPGFRPKHLETLYKQFFYPVFEARLPEQINSIDELSRLLIDKMKCISNIGSFSLIGESWGGVVALKIAQMLEAKGILVSVSLLNGDPKTVVSLAQCFISNDHLAWKLNTMVKCDELSKYVKQISKDNLSMLRVSLIKNLLEENMRRSLNWIRSSLRLVLDNKPWPNKLHTKVLVFKYKRTAEPTNSNDLVDYCVKPACVHIVSGIDYKHMMDNKKMIRVLTDSVLLPFTAENKSPLSEKYKNFYFNYEKLENVD